MKREGRKKEKREVWPNNHHMCVSKIKNVSMRKNRSSYSRSTSMILDRRTKKKEILPDASVLTVFGAGAQVRFLCFCCSSI